MSSSLLQVFVELGSYQRLKKWYLMPPCLTFSIIRYRSRVKWSNPGKGVAPSPTSWCSSYRKGNLRLTLDYSHQLYLTYIYTTNQTYLAIIKIFFPLLKVLFLMKHVKHHNSFIYYIKYKSYKLNKKKKNKTKPKRLLKILSLQNQRLWQLSLLHRFSVFFPSNTWGNWR